MANISAGLLMIKSVYGKQLYLLVHPGGPLFRNKDLGSWTIPKGLVDAEEDMLEAAIREFQEETGILPKEPFYPLGHIKQKGGKVVYGWAFILPAHYSKWDPTVDLVSNTFELQWPPRSGKYQRFPEVDGADWFNLEQGASKINAAQVPLLERAENLALT